jgi:hypothetical protein
VALKLVGVRLLLARTLPFLLTVFSPIFRS